MNPVRALLERGRLALKRRYTARALVLIYHRVGEDPVDPWRLCVSPANFARQLEVVRSLGFDVVTMSTLAEALRGRRLARRTIAITFDDGYRDNLLAARPILERYQTPATHFATAGYIGSDEPFWWDALDLIFLRQTELPEALEINVGGERHRWSLGAAATLKPGMERTSAKWKPFRPAPTRRHEIHDALWRLLVGALPAERQHVVRHLLQWSGLPPAKWADSRPLSQPELRDLKGDGLVEIGAHSLTHPALSALPTELRAHELRASKGLLEKILGCEVGGCSYPQGRSSADVQALAKEAGYSFACGSVAGAVTSSSNIFHLPRASVGNWDAPRFMSLLRHHIAT